MEELLWFDDGTPDGSTVTDDGADTTTTDTVTTEPPVVDVKKEMTELKRTISKDLGINIFEPEGLKQVKDLLDSQKTDQEKLAEQLAQYQERENEWTNERTKLQAQLKATELGIAKDSIEDALKLADGNPDNLEQVVKKYPHFRSQNGITIGMPNNGTPPPTGKTEVEQYMAQDPKYKKYMNN
jgi:hypothetical protein